MLCKWCNKEVENNAKFCPNCGGNLMDSDIQVNQPTLTADKQVVQDLTVNSINNNQKEKVNIGLVILSCLIPIAGLIIFLVKKDNDKKTAKASGIAALISFSISIIITIITIMGLTLFTAKSDKIDDYDYNNIEENNTNLNESDTFDEEESNQNITTSAEWKNYEVTINNNTLKLPCTYNELSNATSSAMQSSYTKTYLESGYYALVNMYKDDKLALYTEVLNDTGVDQIYTDCKITRISQTEYQVSVGAEEIIFPGGLKVGQEITKDEIINLFGTPFDIDNYTSDGYIKDTYSYVEDTIYTTTNYYEISVVNGIIDELTLDNRNYN